MPEDDEQDAADSFPLDVYYKLEKSVEEEQSFCMRLNTGIMRKMAEMGHIYLRLFTFLLWNGNLTDPMYWVWLFLSARFFHFYRRLTANPLRVAMACLLRSK